MSMSANNAGRLPRSITHLVLVQKWPQPDNPPDDNDQWIDARLGRLMQFEHAIEGSYHKLSPWDLDSYMRVLLEISSSNSNQPGLWF
jgi:hypothetical protein